LKTCYRARYALSDIEGDKRCSIGCSNLNRTLGHGDERWDCVDVKAVGGFETPVTLDMCKSEPRLSEMVLVNNMRLSVQPVLKEEWDVVCEMGGYPQKS